MRSSSRCLSIRVAPWHWLTSTPCQSPPGSPEGGHDPPESAVTINQNARSRSPGTSGHDPPESPVTTNQNAWSRSTGIPNILQRDFCATAPNQKWATDVTEFNVNGQKLYLSACMDLYNGEIVAHRMARRPVFELVSSTLQVALSRTRCTAELIVHSDQGWHYKMQPYRAMLARRGVKQSMSRKGNCFDNAVIESFFGTLKAEYFHLAAPNSLDALEAGVHDYISYYNHGRIKLGLQGLSPVEYRLRSTARSAEP
jgi:transposase InsO family protein